MKVPPILLDLSNLMPPGSSVDAGGLHWTLGRVGWLEGRTSGGAELAVSFDVGVAEDAAVAVVIDDVLIGGFDDAAAVQDARLKVLLEGILSDLAAHAARLRRQAVEMRMQRSDDARDRERSALARL